MPRTEVILFAEDDGSCPLIEWMDNLPMKVQIKCYIRIERLEEEGYELRRPEADYLRDKIYELRATNQRIHYRMLYFFHENKGVISHGLMKEKVVPPKEIDLAVNRKARFEKNHLKHTYAGGE